MQREQNRYYELKNAYLQVRDQCVLYEYELAKKEEAVEELKSELKEATKKIFNLEANIRIINNDLEQKEISLKKLQADLRKEVKFICFA